MKYRIAAVRTLGVVAIMAMAYLAGTGGATADNTAHTYSGVTTAIGGQAGLFAVNTAVPVPAANVTPVATADTYSVAPGATLTANVLINDTNADVAQPSGAWNGPSSVSLSPTGALTYTAPAGSSGSYTFSYVGYNGTLQSNVATVTITIETTTSGTGTAVALDGLALYNNATCATCHGTDGVGYKSLSTTTLSNAAFFAKITPPGSMSGTAYADPSLTTTDLQAIADYFAPPPVTTTTTAPATTTTTTTTTTAPASTTTSTAPATGGPDVAALFKASCAGCHSKVAIVNKGLSNQALYAVLTTGLMSQSPYAGIIGSLTPAEFQAIADFIVPPAPPATGGGTTLPSTEPSTTAPAAPGTGASVYNAYCAACHGSDLTGSPMGPGIVGESRSEIAEVVRSGDGAMPAFNSAALSDTSLAMLSDYMATFGSKSGHDDDESDGGHDTTTTTEAAATGSTVYTSYCAACHGADGTGTNLGPDIAGESRSETLGVVRSGDTGMPAFSATMLSNADLAAVADYVAALDGSSSNDGHKKSKGHDEDDD